MTLLPGASRSPRPPVRSPLAWAVRSPAACSLAVCSLAVCSLVAGRVAAQNRDRPGFDDRDTVTLMTGKDVRGRVASRFDREELLLLQGGKRLRFRHRVVRNLHTVDDDIREFFELRKSVGDNAKKSWFLVEWARSRRLPGFARLQALSTVLRHPKSEPARVFLGHRRQGGVWLWPVGARHRRFAAFQAHHTSWARALSLTGEHFRVKTNAGIERAVEMAFDLERMYLFWVDTFGEPLRMREALAPIDVYVWGSKFEFPKISAVQLPYYEIKDAYAATFFKPDGKRPEQLFGVATQALIYATLVQGRPVHERAHVCAWAEIGLGRWMESAFGGPPGRAAPLPRVRLEQPTATLVFRSRPRLNRIIHLHYELYFELARDTALRWAATDALVHYLMSEKPDPKIRGRFMDYLERAFRRGLGDSSTAFDKAMGAKIESMEPKFLRWLQVHN